MTDAPAVTYDDVVTAARILEPVATRTPVEYSRALSELAGCDVYIKCENLQRSGSFKLRGAYVRMAALTEEERARGVVAASAGNHAQGVALAASKLGISATVCMPRDAALPKVAATRSYGAEVILTGDDVDEALIAARQLATETGAVFIHPFDHPAVVAGQGSVGLEIIEQVPDVKTIVTPIGGGGLAAGLVASLGERADDIRVVGVQAENAAAYPASIEAGQPLWNRPRKTMADGIAVGTPGDVPFGMISDYQMDIRTVSEESLSQALLLIAERAKLVVEPAGVAAAAALLADPEGWEGPVVVVLSGGNIDPLVLLRVIRHGLASAGRYLHLRVRLRDTPGALAGLLAVLSELGGNIMQIEHSRTSTQVGVDEAEVSMQIETKGTEHCDELMAGLREAGYLATR